MRKYRYGDPTKASFLRKYGNFIYFFAAWNVMGFVVWKTMSANESAKDEEWHKKSFSEKYLKLIGYGKENTNIKHVKMQGLQIQSSSEEKTS